MLQARPPNQHDPPRTRPRPPGTPPPQPAPGPPRSPSARPGSSTRPASAATPTRPDPAPPAGRLSSRRAWSTSARPTSRSSRRSTRRSRRAARRARPGGTEHGRTRRDRGRDRRRGRGEVPCDAPLPRPRAGGAARPLLDLPGQRLGTSLVTGLRDICGASLRTACASGSSSLTESADLTRVTGSARPINCLALATARSTSSVRSGPFGSFPHTLSNQSASTAEPCRIALLARGWHRQVPPGVGWFP